MLVSALAWFAIPMIGVASANACDRHIPSAVRCTADEPYGPAPRQRLDIYAPEDRRDVPVIVMVHGGGWRGGDKAASTVVRSKVARWVPLGIALVSINYRLLPEADPLQQSGDLALALAHVQRQIGHWGGDGDRVVLMGHSAGAHLAAFVAAAPQAVYAAGGRPWLGTVVLDTAALDVVALMNRPHLRLYDEAFGSDAIYWRRASPLHALNTQSLSPLLLVCSTQRPAACPTARRYMHRAAEVGVQAQVLDQALSHQAIDDQLGQAEAYTAAVESFLAALHPSLAARLNRSGQ